MFDRSCGFSRQATAFLFPGARRRGDRLSLEPSPFFVARLFGGRVGRRFEPGPFLFPGAIGRGRGVRCEPRPFFLARSRGGHGGLGVDPAALLRPRMFGGRGGCSREPHPFFLTCVFGCRRCRRGYARPLHFLDTRRGRGHFRLDAAAFFGACLLRGKRRGTLQPRALFFTRPFDRAGHRRLGVESRPFLFPCVFGRRRRFGTQPANVLVPLPLHRLRFGFRFLPTERFDEGALGRRFGLGAKPLGFPAVFLRLAPQLFFALFSLPAELRGLLFRLDA